ncbi:Uridine kinase [BD1-7 clade bacterium]|uniref:Uridine kinase n=1 Tax=BD1-7 clade bacterium TaxID=2029982 RepID=A0A5S9QPH4_9GAMM|nr:Uridine kinase [BD1-7 clade bacterium]CAA0116527.1 Uridine kinase [BD1-7 clade bacterium]CAA0120156.1 Uridine kinase [BD1-7 clade bacterium]
MVNNDVFTPFLREHQLPQAYLGSALKWFTPMGESIARHHINAGRPIIVGINGCQGSGKTTLADFLAAWLSHTFGLKTLALSLDNFYLTHGQRQTLATDVHPLLATRGVPGTHDVSLMQTTLQALTQSGHVKVPVFDKSMDDRAPEADHKSINAPVDIIILEGWCLGARAESPDDLITPINSLETNCDVDGIWRSYVNQQMADFYPPVFDLIDIQIMLKAPSFDCVYRWRLEQEQKLASRSDTTNTRIMSAADIEQFIAHYQRLTEHILKTMPQNAHFLFHLDNDRQIQSLDTPCEVIL